MTHTYYRSTGTRVAEWLAERTRQHDAYVEAARVFSLEFPGCNPFGWSAGLSSGCACFLGLSGRTSPGPLWRRHEDGRYWVPRRNSTAGKALWDRVQAIRYNAGSIPGLPSIVYGADHMYFPVLHCHGGVHYVSFTCEAALIEADPAFDGTLWQAVKPSAYHLAREAEEGKAG